MIKILIVDDIRENLYMLESLLQGYGYEVESAADGVEALDKASHEDFDMIISDILMPRMDGFQLCREVKKNRKLKEIAFVFYTATYTDTSDEEFALRLGAEKFIVKPTEPDDFMEILKEVIRSHEMGTLKAPKAPIKDETVYLKEYNERLVRKLEDKMLILERVNTGLKESEEKYKDLIDNANDAVIFFKRTGYISFVNPKFCEMTGYPIDEARKLHFNRLIHPDDSDLVTEYFRKRLYREEVPRNYELRILDREGKTIYIDNNASIIEKRGRIIGVLTIMRDITERKRAEKALRKASKKRKELEAIVNNSPAVVFLWRASEGWPVEFVSDNVQQFGYVPEDFYSGRILFTNTVHPDDQERVTAEVAKYSQEGRRDFIQEYRIITKSGKVCWLDDRTWVRRDSNGAITHYQGIVLDITKRKRAEEKMEQEAEITKNLLLIAESTAQTTDIDKLMKGVTECVQKIMRCNVCVSYLWDSETGLFRPREGAGLTHNMSPFFRTESIDVNVSFIKKALDTRGHVVEKMTAGDSCLEIKEGGLYKWVKDIDTVAVIPLLGRMDYLGLLVCIYRKSNQRGAAEFSDRDKKLLQGIASQVSTALEEARLHKHSIDKAMELSHKIETIQTMHEIDKSILSILEPREILEITVNMITKVIPCESATVTLVDREKEVFTYAAGFGVACLQKGELVPFKDTSATDVMYTLRPQYVANLKEVKEPLPMEKRLIDEGLLSHIMVPLTVKGEGRGLLCVGARRPSAFTPEDLSTLEKLSSQISVALENSRLITDLEDLFLGTLRTLAETIDAKSPWTRGHSERVTRFAIDIGKEMGLDEERLRNLELAGLLHDIGKLATYESILDKPGKLAEDELNLIKQHPGKGADILAHIRQLKDIIPAIKHHHEHYNGKGYPEGLKGEEIPLMARILSVADTVDAMGADRPYRRGMLMEEIIKELKRCSGTQFDPVVVDAFLINL